MRAFLRKSGSPRVVIGCDHPRDRPRIRPYRRRPPDSRRDRPYFRDLLGDLQPVPVLLYSADHHRPRDPAIADLGRGAGKWLALRRRSPRLTLFSGFLTFLVCASLFPRLLASTQLASVAEPGSALDSYFTIEMPAPLQVMTALLLSFVVGLGLSMVPRGVLRKGFIEFRAIITRLIETIIIPLLPLHIFDIFLNLTYTGEAASVIRTLLRVVVVVLVLEVVILLTQFCVAGAVARRNPIRRC